MPASPTKGDRVGFLLVSRENCAKKHPRRSTLRLAELEQAPRRAVVRVVAVHARHGRGRAARGRVQIRVAGLADRVVEDEDARRARGALHEVAHLAVVGGHDLAVVAEVPDGRRVDLEREAHGLERRGILERAAVAHGAGPRLEGVDDVALVLLVDVAARRQRRVGLLVVEVHGDRGERARACSRSRRGTQALPEAAESHPRACGSGAIGRGKFSSNASRGSYASRAAALTTSAYSSSAR